MSEALVGIDVGTVRVRDTVEPVDEWVKVYEDRRERFRGLYRKLGED